MLRAPVSASGWLLLRRQSSNMVLMNHVGAGFSRRWMAAAAAATSKQKRALDESQLKGTSSTTTPEPAPPTATAAGTPLSSTLASSTAKASSSSSLPPPLKPTPPAGGGGGSSAALPMALVGLAGVGGLYYFFNGTTTTTTIVKDAETTANVSKEKEVVKSETKEGSKPAAAVETLKTVASTVKDVGNRVTTVNVPAKMKNTADSVKAAVEEVTQHPVGGHRVVMIPPSSQGAAAAEDSTKRSPQAVLLDETIPKRAIAELRDTASDEAAEAILKSHQTLWSSLDEQFFRDLDSLNNAQLKARVVQLATEMRDRTKWEAVRLKEFLAMKEKEKSELYAEQLQKQRLEFEDVLARRLREQEHVLTQQMQGALQHKEAGIQSVIQNALEAQQHEHEQDKQAFEQLKTAEITNRLQEQFGQQMEAYQQKVEQQLREKVGALERLADTVRKLESALAASQTTQQGSVKAHRLSAAALALSEKLGTSSSAAKELEALKIAAGKDGVIATAVRTIPAEVQAGVPTLPELQARFETVHRKCRQAALVPAGRYGLEGQLAGMLFATLKYPPNPEDPAPENDKDNPEYVLVRAKQHVQVGELQEAVEQLDKLKGQAALTVRDWKKDACNRVAVEKALKVIKMECALLNESLSE